MSEGILEFIWSKHLYFTDWYQSTAQGLGTPDLIDWSLYGLVGVQVCI